MGRTEAEGRAHAPWGLGLGMGGRPGDLVHPQFLSRVFSGCLMVSAGFGDLPDCVHKAPNCSQQGQGTGVSGPDPKP